MKANDVVTIYSDPFTESTPEGKARLLECLDTDSGTYDGRIVQRWTVEFQGKYPVICDRFILQPAT